MTKKITTAARSIDTLPLQWIPATVGCYWGSAGGEFYISTYQEVGKFGPTEGAENPTAFPRGGYELTRLREPVGRYATLEEAQAAAEAFDTERKGGATCLNRQSDLK